MKTLDGTPQAIRNVWVFGEGFEMGKQKGWDVPSHLKASLVHPSRGCKRRWLRAVLSQQAGEGRRIRKA